MELQKIIVLCVVVVVVGGGALLLATKSSDQNGDTSNAEQSTSGNAVSEQDVIEANNETALSGQGSLVDLLALGRSITCTYTFSDENGEGSGTGYFDNERMRVDTTFTQDEKMFESHVINDSKKMYSWTVSSEGSFAFVMPYDEFEESDGDFDDSMPMQENTGAETLDQHVTYDCDSWRVDESKFVPPSDIEFVDMSTMFEGMMEGMPEGMMEGMPQFSQ